MRLDIQINTPKGLVECTIKRVIYESRDAFAVDFWQGSSHLGSQITVFCSGVIMRWSGGRYKIIRTRKENYSNELWLELEHLVSCIIQVNE